MRLLILTLPVLVAISACDKQSAPAPQAKPQDAAQAAAPEENGTLDISHRGEAAPSVEFEAPDGKKVNLASFQGKPVLVNLWATWCGPCVAEMPTLDQLAVRQAANLQVLTVSQDSQGHKIVDDWWAKQSFKSLKPYLDAENKLGFAFNTGQVPTTVLYDKNGKEIWRVIGGMNWDGARANTLMAEALDS